MDPTRSIGQRIKEVRGELSQKAFGARIGLSQTAVTALETNQSEPRLGTFNKIVEAFRVNPEWLRTGNGQMAQDPYASLKDAARALGSHPTILPADKELTVASEPAAPRMQVNREGEDGNYWKQIAQERAETIDLLKQLLSSQFPGLSDSAGKFLDREYAAAMLTPEVGFQQAGRLAAHHAYAWVDAALAQPLTVEGYLLKKTA